MYVRMDCVFSRMAGVCTDGLCVQPGGWCMYGWIVCSAGWLVYVRMDCVFSRVAGVCTNGLCVQPGGWCRLWVWNVSVCIVVALRGKSNFYVRGRL